MVHHSSLSYLFQFSSQPSGCNWCLVGSVDLTRFYIPSCHHAIMMHNNCLYIFARIHYQASNTVKYGLWSIGYINMLKWSSFNLYSAVKKYFFWVLFCFELPLPITVLHGGRGGMELTECNFQLIHSWVIYNFTFYYKKGHKR